MSTSNRYRMTVTYTKPDENGAVGIKSRQMRFQYLAGMQNAFRLIREILPSAKIKTERLDDDSWFMLTDYTVW